MIKFKRINLETGSVTIDEFNPSHGHQFTQEWSNPQDYRHQMAAAYKCIEKWNSQQPKTWKYELCKT